MRLVLASGLAIALLALVGLTGVSYAAPPGNGPKGPKTSCADFTKIQIRRCTAFVLSDTMPNDDYYANGSRSATTPGWLGLNEDQDEAQGFMLASENVLLDSLDLALWFRGGVNALDVYLVAERSRVPPNPSVLPYEPDDTAVLEHWQLVNQIQGALGTTGNVVHISSLSHPRLLAGKRYWVYISAPGTASAIGWLGGSLTAAVPGWFAERNSVTGFVWGVFATTSGFALRVTALH